MVPGLQRRISCFFQNWERKDSRSELTTSHSADRPGKIQWHYTLRRPMRAGPSRYATPGAQGFSLVLMRGPESFKRGLLWMKTDWLSKGMLLNRRAKISLIGPTLGAPKAQQGYLYLLTYRHCLSISHSLPPLFEGSPFFFSALGCFFYPSSGVVHLFCINDECCKK